MLLKLDSGFNYSQKYFSNVIYTCLLEYNPSFSESPLSCIFATNLNQTQLALNLYHMIRTSWKSTPIPLLNDRRKFGVRFTSRLQNHLMPISFIKVCYSDANNQTKDEYPARHQHQNTETPWQHLSILGVFSNPKCCYYSIILKKYY